MRHSRPDVFVGRESAPPALLILGGLIMAALGLAALGRVALFCYGAEVNPVILLLALVLLIASGIAIVGAGAARIGTQRIQRQLLADMRDGKCLFCGYRMVDQSRCSECGIVRDYSLEALRCHPRLARDLFDVMCLWGGVAALISVAIKVVLESTSIIPSTPLTAAYGGTLLGAFFVGVGWERQRFRRATAAWLAGAAVHAARDRRESGELAD